MNKNTAKVKHYLKGIFSTIPYEVRVPSGDSSAFFGNYVGQRFGPYDTNTCWDFALCNVIETQLEIERSLNRFDITQLQWFKDQGYIDEDGDFFFSRRWIAILSGQQDKGWDEALGWKMAEEYGMIPFSMLPYSVDDAYDENTKEAFNEEYFDLKAITPEMKALGKEFLERVTIRSEELGSRWSYNSPEPIIKALKQGSLQIGVPVPGYLWNQENVKWNGDKNPSHSVELYKYDETGYYIYDSYMPNLKKLSPDYFIPLITRGIVNAIPMLSTKLSVPIWVQFIILLRRLGIINNG